MSTSSSAPSGLAALRARTPQVLAGAAGALVLVVWIASGSLVMALLVTMLVGGTLGLGAVVVSWAVRAPRPARGTSGPPDVRPTTDLSLAPAAGDRVRRALRGLLARPWVRGDGLVRAATARLASEDALVWTPRGQRVAAPHLWVEWNSADMAEIAERWPLEVLAAELADGYVERAREGGVRRLADRTWVHLLASADVPVGRVVVTAAFSEPQDTALAAASSDNPSAPAPPAAAPRPALAPGPAAGAALPPSPGPAAPPGGTRRPRRPGSTAILVALDPGGTDVELTGPAVHLGRDPHAGVVVDHSGVSWRHLTLRRRDADTWLATDEGSTNGTWVGDDRIAGPAPVRTGDVVGLGADGPRFRLQVRAPEPPGPGAGTRWHERTRQEVA